MPWRAGEGVVQGGKGWEAQRVLQRGRGRVNPRAKGLALGGPRKTAKALWGRQAEHSRQLHLRGRFWKKALVLLMDWLCDIGQGTQPRQVSVPAYGKQ